MAVPGRLAVDRLVAWSPVLLLASLAALTWWLDSQIQAPGARDGNTRHDPDLIVDNFRAVNLGPDGKPIQMLQAAAARHYPDDGITEFSNPKLALTYTGKPSFEVVAQTARLSGDRENVYFQGAVKAVREAETANGRTTGPVTVTTEFLHVVPKEDRVETDKPVTIEEPRGIIRATGLVLNDRDKTLVLRSDVRGTIQPEVVPK